MACNVVEGVPAYREDREMNDEVLERSYWFEDIESKELLRRLRERLKSQRESEGDSE